MTLQDWEALLEANLTDWVTRLVYADWLEEAGQTLLARTQRWMGQNQKSPLSSNSIEWNGPSWDWRIADDTWSTALRFCLLESVWDELPVSTEQELHLWREYRSPQEAVQALGRALLACGIIQGDAYV